MRFVSVSRCCCAEPSDECACINPKNLCYMSITFEGVEKPQYGPDPPDLLFPENEPSQWGVCRECEDWNREWRLYEYPAQEAGDNVCLFVSLQAGAPLTTQCTNYPGADRTTCFPCQSFCDETSLVARMVCSGLVSVDVNLCVKGCPIARWSWYDIQLPEDPVAGGYLEFEADDMAILTDLAPQPPVSDFCYTPFGSCHDNLEGYPACGTTGIKDFYDVDNCLWPYKTDKSLGTPTLRYPPKLRLYACNATPPTNPTGCERCGAKDFDLPTSDFSAVTAATEKTDIDCAIDDDYWEISSGGSIETTNDVDLLEVGCPGEEPAYCRYEVWVRYYYTSTPTVLGAVELYDPADALAVTRTWPLEDRADQSPPCEFGLDVDLEPEFIKVGEFYNDAHLNPDVKIVVVGPVDASSLLRVDHIILRRLP